MPDAAHGLAREIAEAGWARRDRFRPQLTSLDDAVRLAQATADPAQHARAFADVADNPGGGGRGNTMSILQAFHAAGVRDALVGVIHDPALAAEAHRLGEGACFAARIQPRGRRRILQALQRTRHGAPPADRHGARPARHLRQQHAGSRSLRRAADWTASPWWCSSNR